MRNIKVNQISADIKNKIISSNLELEYTVSDKISHAYRVEKSEKTKNLLKHIIDNCSIAKTQNLPMCQDTGMLEIFVRIGTDVFLDFSDTKFKDIYEFLDSIVEEAYRDGYFRKSVVSALTRKNTKTNTPSVVHIEYFPGDKLEIYVVPKGFGCENMSTLKMFNPTALSSEIVDFIIERVKNAGPNPCPPMFLGIGIGGTSEKAMILAKKAQFGLIEIDSDVDEKKIIEEMKNEIIRRANELNIGVFGLGGNWTVLDVNINVLPTHIAGLPVAVSFSCWCNRYKKVVI